MPAGRPTDYREEYNELAYEYCLLGHTDAELAKAFEVDETTINNWKLRYPEFFESIKRGKEIADSKVAASLYHRALGYSHPDVEIKVVSDGQGLGSSIEKVDVIKHYPPDPTSAIFWLKNRQPKKWRDKQEHGFTDEEGKDVKPVINIYNSAPPMASSENEIGE